MRGTVPGLASPHPIGRTLPAMYQDDDLTRRLVAALDEVLAPVCAVLDNLPAYLDPHLAPPDFAAWLAGWVGLPDAAGPRALTAGAAALHARRGTPGGMAAYLTLACGVPVAVRDSGGCAWSADADGALPGDDEPWLEVTVDGDAALSARAQELVAAVKPAHVPHAVRVGGRT
ncbi:tail protein [Pilimelia terevasa]|uniref:Tail protein n=1 Tax=Pilimelia terevasa TaxID=53372 RepID=A0A8J3BHW2_9ACTN|nr:phage tail protein [Pilimelia terevasa]GGK23356.1 tail protein [Pilimelia terevasa]